MFFSLNVERIVTAVSYTHLDVYKRQAKHSNKDCIDDDYSELLKDADVLAQYLAEPDIIFDKHSQERLKKYLPK